MTLMGLYPFAQIDFIVAPFHVAVLHVPSYAALCSYPCRLLFLSSFVHVYHCTVILIHQCV